ncbi:MAG: c-type cytochrome [Nitrospirales bacterium]
MDKSIQRLMGLTLGLAIGVPAALAQEHGHQQMMMPRVPADKMDEARLLKSPLPESPDIVEQGKAIYEGKGTCINCHGAKGRGDGLGAATLNPPPRVFRSHGFWMHRTEGEIFWVIKHGSAGTAMIPFGGLLTDEEIWTVMQYERSFAGGPRGSGGHEGGGRHGRQGMMKHEGGQKGHGKKSGAMADHKVGPGGEVMDKMAKAKAASIGITEAIAAATNHVPGTVLEAEFEAEENQVFWEVEIATEDGKLMEINVDGQTGAILSSEEKKPKEGKKSRRHGKGKMQQESKGEHMGGEGMKGVHMGGEDMKGQSQE